MKKICKSCDGQGSHHVSNGRYLKCAQCRGTGYDFYKKEIPIINNIWNSEPKKNIL